MTISSKEEFKNFVNEVRQAEGYRDPLAFGICRVDVGQINKNLTLQAIYPIINWNENFGSGAIFISTLKELNINLDLSQSEIVLPISKEFVISALEKFQPFLVETIENPKSHNNIAVLKAIKDQGDFENFRIVFLFEDAPLKSAESTYIKLYALSQKKVKIRTINLNGAFANLQNVAWSENKPIELQWLRDNEISLKISGKYPKIDFVDKFPRMLQHIIPENNTRILDGSKVRMGAYISAGTTIMPGASYINFNAGTLGVSMVEGRISSSASVGDGSDVGGGASILGVLSGTNGNPISIGKNSLLGANSVCGIPLGDGSIIDAGLAILEGTKIYISPNEINKLIEINLNLKELFISSKNSFKGKELAGINGIHFRQNSENGRIEAFRSKREVKLNSDLH